MSIKYLVLSDIHLGNTRTKSHEIAEHLQAFFKQHQSALKDLDILFIAGDLFDDLVDYSQPDTYYINDLLVWLIHYCQRHNVILRVLEGTPSHDWGQSRVIETLIRATRAPIDYRYIKDIEIETLTIRDRTLQVLYVPDEIRPTASQIYLDVKKAMAAKSISQVDIAIMHGMFNYQLPHIHSPVKHDERDYLNLVKHYIHIGHIHTPSNYDRIYAQGSFDRLRFGEEEDKGGHLVVLGEEDDIQFLVNRQAKTYVSVNLTEDVEDIVAYMDRHLEGLSAGSYVRMILTEEQLSRVDMAEVKRRYIDYHITKKVLASTQIAADVDREELEIGLSFSSESIIQYIEEELKRLPDVDLAFLMDFVKSGIAEEV